MKRPERVRSTLGTREVDLDWEKTGQYPYFVLGGLRYQLTARGAWTVYLNDERRGDFVDLHSALRQDCWEIVE